MRDDSAGNHARKDIFGREKLFVVGLRAAKSAKTKKKIQKKRNKQKEKQERSWFAVGRSKLFHRASFPFLFVVPNFSFFLVFFSLSFFFITRPKEKFRKKRKKEIERKEVRGNVVLSSDGIGNRSSEKSFCERVRARSQAAV